MTDSYEMIDRYLRNNLSDEDYAEYSEVLEELNAPSAMLMCQIESLRQRVKELEGYKDAWIEAQRGRNAAERELAEIKLTPVKTYCGGKPNYCVPE